MKKLIALLFVLSLLVCPMAFAMQCESSQAYGGSDACWTEAVLSPYFTSSTIVSAGTVMIYDTASGQLSNSNQSLATSGASFVRPSTTASIDAVRVAGVLQVSIDNTKIAYGSPVKLLVRGVGDLIYSGGVTSGDPLVVKASGALGAIGGAGPVGSQTIQPIGFALETYSTETSAKKKAYIKVV